MTILSTILISLTFCSPVLGRIDSQTDFPSKVAHWKFTKTRMDTGELRGCTAHGNFKDLEISFGTPNPKGGPMDISFKFIKGRSTPGPANPGDQRACGPGEKQASQGSWHYSQTRSSVEFCDGKNWLKPTEGYFKKAALILDENELAAASEDASFTVGLVSGKQIFFEYSAWFQRVEGLEKKLSRAGNTKLRIDGIRSGPIELGDLFLDRAFAEFLRCEREGT